MNALKVSSRNKLLGNMPVLIKFWSKKCPVENAQSNQNATEKVVEKNKTSTLG